MQRGAYPRGRCICGNIVQYYVPFKYDILVHSTHAGPLYWLIYIPCTKHFGRLQAGEFHNLTNQWILFTSDPLALPCESGF